MTTTNKLVLSHYDFQLNFLLLAIQSIVCVLMLWLCSSGKLLTFQPFKMQLAIQWFPVSLALVAMIYTGSKALQYLSIPLVTIFKNMTIILIAFSERYLYNGAPVTSLVLVSFGMMVLSSVIAAYSDIYHGRLLKDSAGEVSIIIPYFWMFANCVSSAYYVLRMRSSIKQVGFKDFDTVFYNNVISIPVLVVLSLVVEWNKYYEFYSIHGLDDVYLNGLFWGIFISSVSTFAISYATSWSMRVTSSTTYSMVGALNKLPIAVAGMIFFDDPVTLTGVLGVMLAFFAGLVYSYAKSRPQMALPLYTPMRKPLDVDNVKNQE